MRQMPKEAEMFTKGQKAVFREVLLGKPEKQIAETLSLSQHTIHGHIKTIYRTFSVGSRGELLSMLMRRQEATIEHLHDLVRQLNDSANSTGSPATDQVVL